MEVLIFMQDQAVNESNKNQSYSSKLTQFAYAAEVFEANFVSAVIYKLLEWFFNLKSVNPI